MADKIPLKAIPASGDATAIQELESGDSVGVAHGGTSKTTITADTFWYASALDTLSEAPITTAGRAILDDADNAAQRTTLGFTDPILDKASPGAIGGTTPAAMTCTTLTSTGIDDNATSTALTIDSSQNTTFGGTVSVPSDVLFTGAAGTVENNYTAGSAFIDTNFANTTNDCTMRYMRGTNTSGIRSSIWYKGDGTSTEAMKLDHNTGLLTLSGGQLKFPATQNPSSDANTLDDYEEGTFTPTALGTTSGEATYLDRSGKYTKIGNAIHCYLEIEVDSIAAMVGNVSIGSLPFTGKANVFPTASIGIASGLAIAAGEVITGFQNGVQPELRLQLWDLTTGNSALTVSELNNGGRLTISFTYYDA